MHKHSHCSIKHEDNEFLYIFILSLFCQHFKFILAAKISLYILYNDNKSFLFLSIYELCDLRLNFKESLTAMYALVPTYVLAIEFTNCKQNHLSHNYTARQHKF